MAAPFPRRRALRIASAVVIAATAAIVGPNVWVARAARGRVFTDVASAPARTVAIVPGARVRRGMPAVHLEARLEAALALYRAGKVRAVFASGKETATSPEVTAMHAWLRSHGVPAQDVITDSGGLRTRDTMNRAAGVYDLRDAIICTQDVNAARTVYLAEQAGMDAVVVAVPSRLGESARYVGGEAVKTSLALFESLLRAGPSARAGERGQRTAVAAR